MEWEAWKATDAALRGAFGYRVGDDRASADALHALVPPASRFRDLGVEVRNRRNVVVLGCGPSLARTPPALLEGKVLVAADGAASWLRGAGLRPHLVVTDLDGDPDDLAWAARSGASMVVHAHGDNRPAVEALAPRLLPLLYGTYQGPPDDALLPMRNVGGFTDGDRAVVLCEHLGAKAVTLVGFDFDEPPSPYSHKWDPMTKPAKLAWAKRIVEGVQARGKTDVRRYVP